MNNIKEFGMTLKAAKAICRISIGRLPHPGCEVFVGTYTMYGNHYEVWLQSNAGKLSLRKYIGYTERHFLRTGG